MDENATTEQAPAECRNCGKSLENNKPYAVFCCQDCRKGWNNRRQLRGAELYDLMMVMRYDRGFAKEIGAFQIMCAMAAAFRQDDKAERDGRRSYLVGDELLERVKRYR